MDQLTEKSAKTYWFEQTFKKTSFFSHSRNLHGEAIVWLIYKFSTIFDIPPALCNCQEWSLHDDSSSSSSSIEKTSSVDRVGSGS